MLDLLCGSNMCCTLLHTTSLMKATSYGDCWRKALGTSQPPSCQPDEKLRNTFHFAFIHGLTRFSYAAGYCAALLFQQPPCNRPATTMHCAKVAILLLALTALAACCAATQDDSRHKHSEQLQVSLQGGRTMGKSPPSHDCRLQMHHVPCQVAATQTLAAVG